MTLAHEPGHPLHVSLEQSDKFGIIGVHFRRRQLQMLDGAAHVDHRENGTKARRNTTTQRLYVQILVMAVHAWEEEGEEGEGNQDGGMMPGRQTRGEG